MNEARGQKGDHNDHRRTLIISKKNLKKLNRKTNHEYVVDKPVFFSFLSTGMVDRRKQRKRRQKTEKEKGPHSSGPF